MACRCWVETMAPGRIMRLSWDGTGCLSAQAVVCDLASLFMLGGSLFGGSLSPANSNSSPNIWWPYISLALSLFFLLWTILKIFIESVPTLLLSYVLTFWTWGMWDLSSPKGRVLVTQLCPTLCDYMDYSPPGSSVHGILQERILKWLAIPFLQKIWKVSQTTQTNNENKLEQQTWEISEAWIIITKLDRNLEIFRNVEL